MSLLGLRACGGGVAAARASLVRRHQLRPGRRLTCRAEVKPASHKEAAAKLFVDKYVKSGCVLGVGSGELVNLAIAEVGKRLASGNLKSVTAVASCNAAASTAAFHGVPQTMLDESTQIHVGFEQVDMLDVSANAAIFGVEQDPQQPQILMSRYIMSRAEKLVVLVDCQDIVKRLYGTLPVVVNGDNWEAIGEELDDIFVGDAELWRRSNDDRSQPRGGDDPYVSPEGHNLIDIRFVDTLKLFGEEEPYEKILSEIRSVDGVYSYGLLLQEAEAAVVADAEGEPGIIELQK